MGRTDHDDRGPQYVIDPDRQTRRRIRSPRTRDGVHFFNPAPIMQQVELIPSLTTGDQTLERMRSWVTDSLGKQPIDATDRAGFVVNSLLVPYLLSSIRMYKAGYASAADIDCGMVLDCEHRWARWPCPI